MSDIGTLGFSTEEKYTDYFIVSGPRPKEILQWLSRNSYTDWDTIDKVLMRCKEERIPVDTAHLDTYWFRKDWNPDLIFDDERFADSELKMRKYHEDGIHTSLWQYSFRPNQEDNLLFREGRAGSYLAFEKLSGGSKGPGLFKYPPGSSRWKTENAVIDFSNTVARTWYGKKITGLIEMGASAIKTDFGDCNPPDAWYHSTSRRRFPNTYALAYNAIIAAAMNASNPDTTVWARSGTAGSQRYPIRWGGGSQCSFTALQGSFNATLALGMSGFPFFASDTGGFIGKPTQSSTHAGHRWASLPPATTARMVLVMTTPASRGRSVSRQWLRFESSRT
jgi:alpha-D-xyloside xylohydrolase